MSLPIDEVLPQLQQTLAAHTAVVLQAPPGAGKTTRVPLALLDAPWLAGKRILMLEPRRLAARNAARYMAYQRGEPVGATVGYRMRMDSRTGPQTRIEVVTEGVLTRLLQEDPLLEAYGLLIFDEFHERSLQADLGLALARESQQVLRPDLRLLVMSATLDGERLAALLGDAPMLTSAGRQFPVEVAYSAPGRADWLDHAAQTVRDLLTQDSGSLLVFLPGAGEIRAMQRRLAAGMVNDEVAIMPLAGELDQVAQDAAIEPAPAGQRKVVLTTAIAETSLTIEGIRTVVDCGWARRPQHDPVSGMTRLVTERVSAAAATQRAGRAGRLGPGRCVRLWPESERLAAHAPAEINHADLADLVLELAAWGCRVPTELTWLDPPPVAAFAQARGLLQQLGALDAAGGVTDHGRRLQMLGLPVRLGQLREAGARLGVPHLAAALAALLSERDIFSGDLARDQGADLLRRWHTLQGDGPTVSKGLLQRIRQHATRLAGRAGADPSDGLRHVAALMAAAYPDRVARRRGGDDGRFQLSNGRGAWLPAEDPLSSAEWLVVASLDGAAREARIFLAVAADEASLREACETQIVRASRVVWDGRRGEVVADTTEQLGELVLRRRPLATPDPEAVQVAMLEGVARQGLEMLPWTPALRQWQARVILLRQVLGDPWPDVSDAALRDTLGVWCAPFLNGMTRLSQLAHFPLAEALAHGLGDHAAREALERLAPTHLPVPTGSRIAVDYLPALRGDMPVLSVKLQEMFGQRDNLTVAGGRVNVVLHLLSPARRPAAVTSDLASFWVQGYPQVRKDLRGRYPRHPWPEDPLSAPPQRGTRRQEGGR